jgi:hypothetical protein
LLFKSWPCWLWAALNQGYKVILVVSQDDRWFDIIKRISPATKVFLWQDMTNHFWPVAEVVFSDFDLKGKLMPLWNYITKAVVTLRAIRTPPPGWEHTKLYVSHANCGGITDGRWNVHVYQAKPATELVLKSQASRDLDVIHTR